MMGEQAKDQVDVYQKLLQGVAYVPDGIILVDVRGHILFMNAAASRLTEWSQAEALGLDARSVFNVVNAVTGEPSWNPLSDVLADHQAYGLLPNSVLISRCGREIPIEDTISAFQDENADFVGAIIIFRDVSLSRWHLAKALHRAQHDTLTSLPNRAILHDRIFSALTTLGSRSQVLCLLFIDIDNFKSVNDTLGHTAGDYVLQVLAGRIASCLRGTDLVCRVGGDEFVILLSLSAGVQDVEPVVEKLLKQGRESIALLGTTTSVSFSIGIALRDQQGSDVSAFLSDADLAAYRAKAAGGDRAQLFELLFRDDTRSDRKLEHEIMEALRTGQFVLQYQPIIHCRTGRMVSAEALVRWQHPNGSLLQPISFIPTAERSGLVVPLGLLVLQQCLAQRRHWTKVGLGSFPIAVNVSAVEILSGEYTEKLRKLLLDNDYEPNSLILELTESALLGVEQQRHSIAAIRGLKVQVAMDDFGIGYSNVGYLRQFSVDCVKIDRSFVTGIPHRNQDVILVKAMLAMAASVNATSTAEGIETEEQALFMQRAGCDQAQGFHYSPPLFADELERFFLDNHYLHPQM